MELTWILFLRILEEQEHHNCRGGENKIAGRYDQDGMTMSVRKWSLPVTLLVILILFACSGDPDVQTGHLEWKMIAAYTDSVVEYNQKLWEQGIALSSRSEYEYVGLEPRLLVLSDEASMAALQYQVRPEDQKHIARVNLDSYWVAIIQQGARNRTAASITVGDITLTEKNVVIFAQFSESPAPEDYVPDAPPTSPYYVLRIKKPSPVNESNLAFALQVGEQVISQTCAPQGQSLTWAKLLYNEGGGASVRYEGESPRLLVLANSDAIREHFPSLQSLDEIDFSTHFAVAVYQGRKSTTGFYLEVLDVTRQGNTVTVCVQFHEPCCGGGGAVISPFYVIEVQREADMTNASTFVLTENCQQVDRQVITLP